MMNGFGIPSLKLTARPWKTVDLPKRKVVSQPPFSVAMWVLRRVHQPLGSCCWHFVHPKRRTYIFFGGLREPKESPTKLLNKLHVVLNVCLVFLGLNISWLWLNSWVLRFFFQNRYMYDSMFEFTSHIIMLLILTLHIHSWNNIKSDTQSQNDKLKHE